MVNKKAPQISEYQIFTKSGGLFSESLGCNNLLTIQPEPEYNKPQNHANMTHLTKVL